MKAIGWAAALALVAGLSACGGSDTDSVDASAMPGVTGDKLDVALGDIKDAGFDEDVDVDGGGALGIIDESNWEVCEQTPDAGEPITDAPKLTVDRSCDSHKDESTNEAAETTTTAPANLTVDNSPELAALLSGPAECDESVAQFAAKYRGRNIEFDGNIAAMANHGSYDTRYDILVYSGDYNPDTASGPSFQFRDVNFSDLNVTGDGADSITEGDNVHIIATVGDLERDRCVFLLEPVSTALR